MRMVGMVRRVGVAFALMGVTVALPAQAQIRTVDPDQTIDGDLSGSRDARPVQQPYEPAPATPEPEASYPDRTYPDASPADQRRDDERTAADPAGAATEQRAASAARSPGETYHEDDLIGAAEGVFGKGAKGLADVIRDILKKQGEPNAYIVGREGSGAFVVGLRYGSGTLYHKVEGEQPVYWTGPSVGFDAGANAGNAFVLVYNLDDTADLYKRFVAGEGQAYLIGGFNVSYLRRGRTVVIPVRVGAGLRLGANVGYMKFSHNQDWMPF